MKTYEEMSEIVLARISAEKEPLWKSILRIVLKRLFIGLITVLIILTLIFIAWQLNGQFAQDIWMMD